ncbi:MAG: hypothetical protein UV80_C0004G0045 [Candidatus Peregrinibacteria bacterium GW2011_GWF2_43_17]|nr:MAG: hypothetical protein UV80_C0004G0045 [Candidatus Peregrinibacteria bacterium GW2011_GWF2_43_17]
METVGENQDDLKESYGRLVECALTRCVGLLKDSRLMVDG